MKPQDHFISANNQIQTKQNIEFCLNDEKSMYCIILSNIAHVNRKLQAIKHSELEMIMCQHWQLPIKCRANPEKSVAIFLENIIFHARVRSGCFFLLRFSSQSLCSWWDQPLLGTLMVVTLQLPCERKGVKGEKRGRDESKHHQKGQSDLSESSRPAD